MYQLVMHILSKFYCITWIGSTDIAFLVFDVIVYNLCGNYGINYVDVEILMKNVFSNHIKVACVVDKKLFFYGMILL